MNKDQAIKLLGGNIRAAAEAIGIEYQAVKKWPEKLPPRIQDRVISGLVIQGKTVPESVIAERQSGLKKKQAA